MSIGRVGQRRQVVIPKQVCVAAGLHEGDFVDVQHRNGTVVIKPKRLVDAEETLTPAEEKKVARGFKQLQRGRSTAWKVLKRDLGM